MAKFDLDKIKAKLIMSPNTTFFTTLMYSVACKESNEVETAATDGSEVWFNPAFMELMDEDDQFFILLHELGHVGFCHPFRFKEDMNQEAWQVACDYWVNDYLVSQGYKLPKIGGLLNKKYNHEWAVNEIYDDLMKDPDNIPKPDMQDVQQPGSGEGGKSSEGEGGEGVGKTQEQMEQLQQKAMNNAMRAAMAAEQAKEYGTIPSGLKRAIDEYLNPQLPWGVVLSNFLADKAADDYTWSKPNRRYADIYMPTRFSEAMGNINVYVDCSISVTQSEFEQEMGEVNSIKDIFDPAELKVIFFNHAIESEHVFLRDEPIDLTLPKSGGTDIGPVMKHLEDNPADVAIIFTDGHFYQKGKQPDTEIFWGIVNNKKFTYPFGTVLNVEV